MMQERDHSPYFDLPRPQPAYTTNSLNPSLNSEASSFHDEPYDSTRFPPNSSVTPRSYPYGAAQSRRSITRRRRMIGLGAVVVALALVLVVCLVMIKKHDAAAATSGTSNAGNSSSSGGNIKTPAGVLIGGDGSTVTTDSGQTFTYTNSFGGYCEFPSFFATKSIIEPLVPGLSDPENPFASGARANSWTPALNESWTGGVDRVFGVNLGGWFVLEPCVLCFAA